MNRKTLLGTKGMPSSIELLFQGILAFFALLALRVNVEVGSGLETGNFIVDNLSKLSNQFWFDGIGDLLIFGAILMLLRFAAVEKNSPSLVTVLLAFIFGVFYAIAIVCRDVGNFSFFFANFYQLVLSLCLILGFSALFYGVLNLVFHFMSRTVQRNERPLRRPLLSAACIMFLCWLPWILMNYPCSLSADSIGQLAQALGNDNWAMHHPPLNTAIIAICVTIGKALWDINFGCFLYVLLQTVLGACVFSYGMALLYQRGLSRRAWIIILLFFTATPFWGCFMQWLEKDLIYAEVYLLILLLVLPVIEQHSCSIKRAVLIGTLSVIAILLRKTGLYELLPLLFVLCIYLKSSSRKRILAALLAALCLSTGVNHFVYPSLDMEPASIKESLNIPFQQTARYVNQYPDEISDWQKEAIDAVLVYDELDKYKPEISDPVKNNYRGNSSALPEYFKAWFSMLLKHPMCYFEAAFMISYGYFAPVVVGLDAFIQHEYFDVAQELGVYRVFDDFPTRAFDSIRQMFIPLIMTVLICIASPLSSSLRYLLPVIATTPFTVAWTLLNIKSDK